jgi:excinuclease UvrABC ATPase subunit
MREIACETCNGARLKPEVLAVTIGNKNRHGMPGRSTLVSSK